MTSEEDLKSELKAFSIDIADKLRAAIEMRFEKIEESSAVFEQQLALLTASYAELAALIQAMFSFFVNGSDQEKTKEFNEHLRIARQTMMDNLSYATSKAEQSTTHFVATDAGTAFGSQDDPESESD